MNIDYAKIAGIPRIENDTLVLDFAGADFLNTFEIVELFSYLVQFPFDGEEYEIINESDASRYLYRVNFYAQLEQIKNLAPHHSQNPYGGMSNRLLELQKYRHKDGFYGDYPRICDMLQNIGVDQEKISLIASSLGEVNDNAFSHNLGKWSVKIGPLVIFLAQNFPNKKELCFAYADFGIGFLHTLQFNYPELTSEASAVIKALEPNVTGRPQKRGGNGLDYLQRNVFNGFRGSLFIRSKDKLINAQTKKEYETPLAVGASVLFTLHY